jgi:single-strand DNA-binding protein
MNNVVMIIGHVGKDPVLTTRESGATLAQFSVAVKEFSKGNEEVPPMWVDVEAWGDSATRVMMTLKKGREVSITGRLQISTYDRKVGEVTIKMTKVVVKVVGFHACGRRTEEPNSSQISQPQDVKLEAAASTQRRSKKGVA